VLIDDTYSSGASYFYPNPVCSSSNIYAKYEWSYAGEAEADGIAFVFQSVNVTTLGDIGDSLGAQLIPNAFVIGYSFYHEQLRVYSTDSNGNIYNETVANIYIPYYTSIVLELKKTGPTQYTVYVNSVAEISFDYTVAHSNYLGTTGVGFFIGVTASTGSVTSEVLVYSIYYSSTGAPSR